MTDADLLLSVIVCTRNRAPQLRRALESLASQDLEAGRWEVVVVDNGSTDDTPAVVKDFQSKLDMRYVYEPTPGLGRARNAGLAVIRGHLVALTDDDVVVHPDWASRIVERFVSEPDVAALFGYTYGAPDLSPLYSLHTAPHPYYLTDRRQVWESTGGNNMAFRREVIARIGSFDPLLGAGARYPAGEDADWYYRLLKAGFKGVYDPVVKVKHEPDTGRRSPEDVILRDDAGTGAWFGKHAIHGDAYALWMFIERLGRAVGGRSLVKRFLEDGVGALRLPAKRLSVLTRAFLSRAAQEVRRGWAQR